MHNNDHQLIDDYAYDLLGFSRKNCLTSLYFTYLHANKMNSNL